MRISALGGHHGNIVAVWRPGAGTQWWQADVDVATFTTADVGYVNSGLRLTSIRVLADPPVKPPPPKPADPQMSGWVCIDSQEIDNTEWTEECQGMTCDGSAWLVSSNNADFKGVHRLSLDLNTEFAKVAVPPQAGSHVGALDYHMATDRLYVAVEGGPSVWVLDKQLNTISVSPLGGGKGTPQGGEMPWCAFNPADGLLYSSTFTGVTQVHAYDPANGFVHVSSIALGGPALNNVQGGCFSAHGHLYLSEDSTGRVHGYDAATGASVGSAAIPYSPGGVSGEEVEGLGIAKLHHANGQFSWVHVVVLDNDITNKDDVFIKHFAVPNPANL
ncbi:MAG TPA: hypothetical protein VN706_02430 [Gemmatimonadaceae bacterium]|nr:hypothetical protein [Gemmatimonadaceae bacterium]